MPQRSLFALAEETPASDRIRYIQLATSLVERGHEIFVTDHTYEVFFGYSTLYRAIQAGRVRRLSRVIGVERLPPEADPRSSPYVHAALTTTANSALVDGQAIGRIDLVCITLGVNDGEGCRLIESAILGERIVVTRPEQAPRAFAFATGEGGPTPEQRRLRGEARLAVETNRRDAPKVLSFKPKTLL